MINFQEAFKLHRMDIRLGRLKMPIENSLGYYELPSGDVSTTIQPSSSSSVPIEKPLANNCQPEQPESHETQDEAARYIQHATAFSILVLTAQVNFSSLQVGCHS